ncbi:sulfotransferase [Methylotuvimicrobium sp. KM2]|uniref:sulfotransferase n=1 Tax=Methylotuvimicrobium sp. KM2 TaxID=3133976 RepID=UPI003101361E
MSRPNFLIAGAAKSGTTSLDGYLKQHPDVFLPEIKECRYFSNISEKNINPFSKKKWAKIISNKKEYYNLFVDKHNKAIGDISPDYLYYYEESIKNIKSELGESVKIILILRNPIDRAYSNYLHIVRDGFDQLSIEEILRKEDDWVKENIWYGFFITKPGFYYQSVKSYLENFDDVKIIIFDDFLKDKENCLKELCIFLGIDETFQFRDPSFKNKTGLPKYKFLDSIIKSKYPFKPALKKLLTWFFGTEKLNQKLEKIQESNLVKPTLDKATKKRLFYLYKNDIERLEKLIDRDLSHWKII